MGRRLRIVAVGLLASTVTSCSWALLRGYAEGPSSQLVQMANPELTDPGAMRFAFDDLGALNTDALETHAIPWRLFVAALVTEWRAAGHELALEEASVLPILQEFGLIVPDTVLNTGEHAWPDRLEAPVGLLRGRARRGFPAVELEVANLGCAACHAGVMYDALGNPTRSVWLGLPNTSLHLDGLTRAVYGAFLHGAANPEELRTAVDAIYPDLDPVETRTLDRHLLPELARETAHRRSRWDALIPYAPGSPGTANGVGALHHVLGLVHPDEREIAIGGSVDIPDLGDRLLKTGMAIDATFAPARDLDIASAGPVKPIASKTLGGAPSEPIGYAPITPEDLTGTYLDRKAEVIAFFTVTTMGLGPHRVPSIVPRVRDIVNFIHDYRPPPFPAEIDGSLASRGDAVFRERCSRCHGDYGSPPNPRLERYPNAVVPIDLIGTDRTRWEAATPELAKEIMRTPVGSLLSVRPSAGYVAPPLTGLWASAPYLHNGSVPTIWHLMHPNERPDRFLVGGHRLSYEMLGIDGALDSAGVYSYPEGYHPWSIPALYDTALPGRSNSGHAFQFEGLTEADKRALIEYLKLL